MQQFSFSARDERGELRSGVVAAASSGAAAADLAGRGWVPLQLKPAGASPASSPARAGRSNAGGTVSSMAIALPGMARLLGSGNGPVARRGGNARQQQALGLVLREIAALLKAGVPILRALRLSSDACHDEVVRGVLLRLAADLDAGRDLSGAAAREAAETGLLDDFDVAMLRVGERTGRLIESFHALHQHREFMRSTREQLAQAVRYPAFVIGTCVLALVVVNVFVIPQFAKVFRGLNTELPMLTQVLMGMSNLMVNHWPALLAVAGATVFGFGSWTRSPAGRLAWDRLRLRLPLVGGLLRGIVMTRFTKSFASVFGAGLTVPQAIEVTAQTLGNTWVEQRVRGMVADLERGASITQAARHADVFPPMLLQLIAIGEETGSLEELTREMGQHFENEVSYGIRRLSATIEPLLIWFLGIGVLLLALGVFMPMWELGSASIKQ
jgi:MSHA biogenesis protein MshG